MAGGRAENLIARKIKERAGRPDWVIFTDAATSAEIIAAISFKRADFEIGESASEVISAVAGPYWDHLFDKTNKIYGLEMLALLEKLYRPNWDIRNQNATFHIDNRNAFEAVIKNNATPTVIGAMAHLIWHRIRALQITAWFEWAPGTRNIADLPTRNVDIPFVCRNRRSFENLRELHTVIEKATRALEVGRPIAIPSTLGQ